MCSQTNLHNNVNTICHNVDQTKHPSQWRLLLVGLALSPSSSGCDGWSLLSSSMPFSLLLSFLSSSQLPSLLLLKPAPSSSSSVPLSTSESGHLEQRSVHSRHQSVPVAPSMTLAEHPFAWVCPSPCACACSCCCLGIQARTASLVAVTETLCSDSFCLRPHGMLPSRPQSIHRHSWVAFCSEETGLNWRNQGQGRSCRVNAPVVSSSWHSIPRMLPLLQSSCQWAGCEPGRCLVEWLCVTLCKVQKWMLFQAKILHVFVGWWVNWGTWVHGFNPFHGQSTLRHCHPLHLLMVVLKAQIIWSWFQWVMSLGAMWRRSLRCTVSTKDRLHFFADFAQSCVWNCSQWNIQLARWSTHRRACELNFSSFSLQQTVVQCKRERARILALFIVSFAGTWRWKKTLMHSLCCFQAENLKIFTSEITDKSKTRVVSRTKSLFLNSQKNKHKKFITNRQQNESSLRWQWRSWASISWGWGSQSTNQKDWSKNCKQQSPSHCWKQWKWKWQSQSESSSISQTSSISCFCCWSTTTTSSSSSASSSSTIGAQAKAHRSPWPSSWCQQTKRPVWVSSSAFNTADEMHFSPKKTRWQSCLHWQWSFFVETQPHLHLDMWQSPWDSNSWHRHKAKGLIRNCEELEEINLLLPEHRSKVERCFKHWKPNSIEKDQWLNQINDQAWNWKQRRGQQRNKTLHHCWVQRDPFPCPQGPIQSNAELSTPSGRLMWWHCPCQERESDRKHWIQRSPLHKDKLVEECPQQNQMTLACTPSWHGSKDLSWSFSCIILRAMVWTQKWCKISMTVCRRVNNIRIRHQRSRWRSWPGQGRSFKSNVKDTGGSKVLRRWPTWHSFSKESSINSCNGEGSAKGPPWLLSWMGQEATTRWLCLLPADMARHQLCFEALLWWTSEMLNQEGGCTHRWMVVQACHPKNCRIVWRCCWSNTGKTSPLGLSWSWRLWQSLCSHPSSDCCRTCQVAKTNWWWKPCREGHCCCKRRCRMCMHFGQGWHCCVGGRTRHHLCTHQEFPSFHPQLAVKSAWTSLSDPQKKKVLAWMQTLLSVFPQGMVCSVDKLQWGVWEEACRSWRRQKNSKQATSVTWNKEQRSSRVHWSLCHRSLVIDSSLRTLSLSEQEVEPRRSKSEKVTRRGRTTSCLVTGVLLSFATIQSCQGCCGMSVWMEWVAMNRQKTSLALREVGSRASAVKGSHSGSAWSVWQQVDSLLQMPSVESLMSTMGALHFSWGVLLQTRSGEVTICCFTIPSLSQKDKVVILGVLQNQCDILIKWLLLCVWQIQVVCCVFLSLMLIHVFQQSNCESCALTREFTVKKHSVNSVLWTWQTFSIWFHCMHFGAPRWVPCAFCTCFVRHDFELNHCSTPAWFLVAKIARRMGASGAKFFSEGGLQARGSVGAVPKTHMLKEGRECVCKQDGNRGNCKRWTIWEQQEHRHFLWNQEQWECNWQWSSWVARVGRMHDEACLFRWRRWSLFNCRFVKWGSVLSKSCCMSWIFLWQFEIFKDCEEWTHIVEEQIELLFALFGIANEEVGILDVSVTQHLVESMLLWQIVVWLQVRFNCFDCWVACRQRLSSYQPPMAVCKTAQAQGTCLANCHLARDNRANPGEWLTLGCKLVGLEGFDQWGCVSGFCSKKFYGHMFVMAVDDPRSDRAMPAMITLLLWLWRWHDIQRMDKMQTASVWRLKHGTIQPDVEDGWMRDQFEKHIPCTKSFLVEFNCSQ